MSARTWFRVGAASGIASVVIQVAGGVIHGYPRIGASKAELLSWASGTDETRFAIGLNIEAVGILLFLVFAAWLFQLLRQPSPGPDWLSSAAFGSAIVWVAMANPINEIWFAVLKAAKAGLDPQLIVVIRDLAQDTFNVSNLPLGLFVFANGAAVLRARSLPAWLGWVAIVAGAAIFIPVLSVPASLLFFLWILVVCTKEVVRPSVVD
jgi:hypothetical protein